MVLLYLQVRPPMMSCEPLVSMGNYDPLVFSAKTTNFPEARFSSM